MIVLPDFSSQKIRQRKKSTSVISAGSSVAGERYQNVLLYLHSKAGDIIQTGGLRDQLNDL